ncbi:hypothetical protein C6P40_003606 [Pichia californica]|uniref:Protein arginine methyltransferase NDUFAF7 n=1 Tax=Pichia californica TaxID=460514 RepID=A0A9P7BH94_9ASCO|nr:hypothetical protein C6P42_003372 [[Candida] californica]KAG0690215.1 hypothetical protein C6P40_003606 [[Candida] californica]
MFTAVNKNIIFRSSRLAVRSSVFSRSVILGPDGKPINSTDQKDFQIIGLDGKPISSADDKSNPLYHTQSMDNSLSNTDNLTIVLKNMIKTTGPISVSNFMKECLINPNYGYYTTRNPLDNKTGDFITSPEISSTFGEICGLWFFSAFLKQLKFQATNNRENFKIKEKTFRLIEFGPGRGTLMFDMVRTLNRFIKNNNPIEIVFIEKSNVLINEQFNTLCDKDTSKLQNIDEFTFTSTSKWGNKITWLKDDKLDLLSKDKKYMNFIMAHEFFDAIPMNRFTKTDKGWREFLVDIRPDIKKDSLLPNVTTIKSSDLNKSNKKLDAEFVITQAPYATASAAIPKTNKRYDSLPVNSQVEISAESQAYIYDMGSMIKSSDIGAGLVIDYGTTTIPTNSLRGIKDHKFINPLSDVGEVDLSIDVDFGSLSEILKTNEFETYVADQGDFLNSMGLGYRIDQLMSKFVDEEVMKKNLTAAYKRLTGKGIRDMGKVYKVMGYFDTKYKETNVPPGFGGDLS